MWFYLFWLIVLVIFGVLYDINPDGSVNWVMLFLHFWYLWLFLIAVIAPYVFKVIVWVLFKLLDLWDYIEEKFK